MKSGRPSAAKIQKGFFKYVFVSRNTWILGRLKHIETTLIVLPKTIIEAIKGRGQDLEYNFTDVGRYHIDLHTIYYIQKIIYDINMI